MAQDYNFKLLSSYRVCTEDNQIGWLLHWLDCIADILKGEDFKMRQNWSFTANIFSMRSLEIDQEE